MEFDGKKKGGGPPKGDSGDRTCKSAGAPLVDEICFSWSGGSVFRACGRGDHLMERHRAGYSSLGGFGKL